MAHERALFFMLKSRFLVNLVVSDSPQRPYQIQRMVLPMKIKVSQLSNRVHEVKVTNRILRNTLKYQLSMAESDDVENKSFTEQLHASLNAVNSNTDFIVDTLNLNKAEKEKLDDLSFAETVKIATRVALRVQGLSDEDIDMSAKKADASKSEDEDN